jgi:hypothetical protein
MDFVWAMSGKAIGIIANHCSAQYVIRKTDMIYSYMISLMEYYHLGGYTLDTGHRTLDSYSLNSPGCTKYFHPPAVPLSPVSIS